MLAFSLGTLPALLSLSAMSSFVTGSVQRHFLKFAGAAVIVLGITNIHYGLVLTGSGMNASLGDRRNRAISPVDGTSGGKQIVTMRVVDFNYIPTASS